MSDCKKCKMIEVCYYHRKFHEHSSGLVDIMIAGRHPFYDKLDKFLGSNCKHFIIDNEEKEDGKGTKIKGY